MLPFPATFSSNRDYARYGRRYRSTKDVLLTRARVTNLGFLLLAGFSVLSFLVNLGFYFSSGPAQRHSFPHFTADGLTATIDRDDMLTSLDHLIIVPGHAIWTGTSPERRLDDDEWILEPYQRGGGRVSAFYNHIATGVELAKEDGSSLLVFSGGQTRRTSTTTEAESYLRLALASGLLSLTSTSATEIPVAARATTEDYALDSFQNLLFSIARFHEYTGRYPERITVVGYEMKRRRFTELHRAAFRWPIERFEYIGIDPDGERALQAQEGERVNGYMPYTLDTYGCHDTLIAKRRQRNPFVRYHSYYTSAPELGPLFDWCPGREEGGQTAAFPGLLPWDGL